MYKIKEFELHRIEGLSLAQIETLKVTNIEQFLIILGRNGCGKSKIMSLLFPVAPAKKLFGEKGYYRNLIDFNGEEIEFLIKRVNESIKCFITNKTTNTKICDSVNTKVYNAYVEELTGLTPSIVRIITGKDDFTEMSALVRKQWLDKFSSNDMTFALDFYQKLKESHRDSTGIIKHLSKSLADATLNAKNDEEVRNALASEIEHVKKALDVVNNEIQNNPRFKNMTSVTDEDLKQYFDEMSSLADATKLKVDLSLDDLNIGLATKQLEDLHTTLGKVEEGHKQTSIKLTEIDEEIQKHEYYLKNRAPLEERRNEIEAKIKKLCDDSCNRLKFKDADPQYLESSLREIKSSYTRIDSICDSLKVGNGRKATIEEHESLKEKILALESETRGIETAMRDTQSLLDHFNHTENVNCPKCATTFKPGLVGVNKASLEEDLNKCNLHLRKLATDHVELLRVCGEVGEQVGYLNEIHEWVVSNVKMPVMSEIINGILDERVIQNSPKQLHIYLKNAIEDIVCALEYKKLMFDLNKANESLVSLNKTENCDVEALIKEREKISLLLEDKQTHLLSLRNEIVVKRKNIETVKRIISAKIEFESRIVEADNKLLSYVTGEALKDLMEQSTLYTEQWIALRDKSLKLEDNIRYRETAQLQYDSQREKQKLLAELIESMSPEKGLLKEYYFNSVTRIVDLMNGYLSDAWSYPLSIKPCPIENGQLSYNFPYEFGQDDKIVSDVSEGSEAQKQMFNLVFRLATYRALGLDCYPLLLDEPGTGFDENHRALFIDFVKDLIEESEFSQLILVSHYSDVHSRLNRADFLVVDPEGITPPLVYNENTKIKYYEV